MYTLVTDRVFSLYPVLLSPTRELNAPIFSFIPPPLLPLFCPRYAFFATIPTKTERTNERTNDFPSARRPSLCHLAYPRPSPYLALALPISLLDVAFAQQFSPQFKLLPPATDTKSSTKRARLIAMHSPVPLVLVVDVGTRAINGARREATEREREREKFGACWRNFRPVY